ncbi:MAG: WYL domain-containing protein, partial [Clostridia bacterium]|nr:WYL domain-containing protein [Clostridia bacterium]
THQADKLDHHAIVKNRVKTSNTAVFYTVSTINDAIGDGGTDTRSIKFQYLKHTLQDITHQEKRKKGADYVVTPYKLIIDNGNYYLLGFDEIKKNMRTYRVDRMTNVKIQKEYNADPKKFDDIDIEHYTQEHFGMFGGELERVTLNCSIRLLETMIDRFGLEGISYIPSGKSFFDVRISVYVSDQFFGWISGFGKQIQITSPLSVREQYAEYLQKITEWHSRPLKK